MVSIQLEEKCYVRTIDPLLNGRHRVGWLGFNMQEDTTEESPDTLREDLTPAVYDEKLAYATNRILVCRGVDCYKRFQSRTRLNKHSKQSMCGGGRNGYGKHSMNRGIAGCCQLAENNMVLTVDGYRMVKDLVGTTFTALLADKTAKVIIDGFTLLPRKKTAYRIELDQGYVIECGGEQNIQTDHVGQNTGLGRGAVRLTEDEMRPKMCAASTLRVGRAVYIERVECGNIDRNGEYYRIGSVVGNVFGDGYRRSNRAVVIKFNYIATDSVGFRTAYTEASNDLQQEVVKLHTYDCDYTVTPTMVRRGVSINNEPTENAKYSLTSLSLKNKSDEVMDFAIKNGPNNPANTNGNKSKQIKIDILKKSKSFKAGFISGDFAADATISEREQRIVLTHVNRPSLIVIQLLLHELGIRSSISKRGGGCWKTFPPYINQQPLYCLPAYQLNIGGVDIDFFNRAVTFYQKDKADKLDRIMVRRCTARTEYIHGGGSHRYKNRVNSITRSTTTVNMYEVVCADYHKLIVNGMVIQTK